MSLPDTKIDENKTDAILKDIYSAIFKESLL
ncbi:hypothetical protein Xish_02429 [Xenorhabdus ishibashii]|uniref:Uncharacterized protein n=1 Tax=Xenorhabdus ishibashii TaxID=1034471 RepID=A0A2D0KJ07_9GAMM|nr:hypothetical protein Xish_02429 [Xenorhabdus ishibashii]